MKSKQTRTDQPRAAIDGDTGRHAPARKPASLGKGGNISPNSHDRGKQGQ
jgi:hypothetical protein